MAYPEIRENALAREIHVPATGVFIAAAETGSITLASKRVPMSREYFLALFIRDRLEPNVVWSSPKLDVVRTMVANGLGYTLANVRPRADVALDGRRVLRVPLSGDPPPVRIGVATLKQLKKTRGVDCERR